MNDFNEQHIRMTYRFLAHKNQSEIRLIDPNVEGKVKCIFVSTEDEFVNVCKEHNGTYNIYVGINERTNGGTYGKDVISVKTIVIDIDPKRKTKTASTDKELEKAHDVACQIEYDILQMGFEKPRVAMSGNGYQLWFAIPEISLTDDFRKIMEGKIKIFNDWFIDRYSTSSVNIDNIGDLPRIIKVIGTKSVKGVHTEETPHRVSFWIKNKADRVEDKNLKEFIIKLEGEMKIVNREITFETISEERWKNLLNDDEKLRDLMDGNWEKYYPGKSRSEAESGLVTKLITYGIPKEQIFSIMNTCKIGKWQEKTDAYKERTYETAAEFYKTRPKKQDETVEKIKQIEWIKDNITVLYSIGNKGSEDMVAVTNNSKPLIVRVKFNLRENESARSTFERKLKGLLKPEDFIELYQKISVGCVGSVDSVDYNDTPKISINNYVPLGVDDDFIYIHPALDFVNDKMYVGVNLTAKDSDGNVDLMPFIVKNNDLISIPSLPEYSIKVLKQPMVYKRFFKIFSTPTYVSTQPTDATQPTLQISDCFIQIKQQLDKYIEFSDPTSSTLLAVWIIGTYIYKVFNAYPYISLLGYKGTGKTKVMDVCSFMAFNGTTSVGISPSALFRGTDSLSWALFFDEAELFKAGDKRSKRAEELMPLILAGYKKGGLVPRIGSKETGFKLEFFNTYCPKMFASTEEMDWILESRCIQVVMRPAFKGGAGEREPDEFNIEWEDLRTSILYACLHEWTKIRDTYFTLVNDTSLTNRDYELTKPLLSIAKYINEDVYNEIKKYMEQTTSDKTGDNLERSEFYILKALVALDQWEDIIEAHTIIGKVNELKGGFKPEWMNTMWLGRNLKKLNFPFEKPRSSRGFSYIFKKENVYNACRRFGIDAEVLNKEFRPSAPETDPEIKQRTMAEW
jgi:hypothetical protein